MMKIQLTVVVLAVLVAVTIAHPKKHGGLRIMRGLAKLECADQEDTSACEGNTLKCLKDMKKPDDTVDLPSLMEEIRANMTECAEEAGFTTPEPSQTETRPHHGPFAILHRFKEAGLSKEDILPIMQCLMTKAEMLDQFRTCVNTVEE